MGLSSRGLLLPSSISSRVRSHQSRPSSSRTIFLVPLVGQVGVRAPEVPFHVLPGLHYQRAHGVRVGQQVFVVPQYIVEGCHHAVGEHPDALRHGGEGLEDLVGGFVEGLGEVGDEGVEVAVPAPLHGLGEGHGHHEVAGV